MGKGRILNVSLVRGALCLVKKGVEGLIKTPGNYWGPQCVAFEVRGPGLEEPVTGIIGDPVSEEDWNPEWGQYSPMELFGEIASAKCQAAQRCGMPTSRILVEYPEEFQEGEWLYKGGVCQKSGGLAVGVSGVSGETDEEAAWLIYHKIRELTLKKANSRVNSDQREDRQI